MKSKHIIYYPIAYTGKAQLDDLYFEEFKENLDDDFYYDEVKEFFNNPKIMRNYLCKKTLEKLSLNLSDKTYILDIDKVILRKLTKFNLILLEIYVLNNSYTDYLEITRNLDKNTGFGKSDIFESIYIDGIKLVSNSKQSTKTANNINDLFFESKLQNIRILMGRKNYQVISIASDTLSDKVENIYSKQDFEIYKIATGEGVEKVGEQTFDYFKKSIYDKWISTGSIYILNNVNMLQIVKEKNDSFQDTAYSTYSKFITMVLIQKSIFITFRELHSKKRMTIERYNIFTDYFYLLEVSYDSQAQQMYKILQEQLNTEKYYNRLEKQITVLENSKVNKYVLFLTLTYTILALLSVLIAVNI